MTAAIAGVTGQLGRLVVNKLKEKVSDAEIVALGALARKGRRPRSDSQRSELRPARNA